MPLISVRHSYRSRGYFLVSSRSLTLSSYYPCRSRNPAASNTPPPLRPAPPLSTARRRCRSPASLVQSSNGQGTRLRECEGAVGVFLAPDQSLGEFHSSGIVTSTSYPCDMQGHPLAQVPLEGSDKAPEPRRCAPEETWVLTGRGSRPAAFWEW